MNREIDIAKLKETLGIEVRQVALFQEALTHRSYLNEHKSYKYPHNERLEFLGDAVLELVVTENLFHNYENPEGFRRYHPLRGA